jgi:hypothetical protein
MDDGSDCDRTSVIVKRVEDVAAADIDMAGNARSHLQPRGNHGPFGASKRLAVPGSLEVPTFAEPSICAVVAIDLDALDLPELRRNCKKAFREVRQGRW